METFSGWFIYASPKMLLFWQHICEPEYTCIGVSIWYDFIFWWFENCSIHCPAGEDVPAFNLKWTIFTFYIAHSNWHYWYWQKLSSSSFSFRLHIYTPEERMLQRLCMRVMRTCMSANRYYVYRIESYHMFFHNPFFLCNNGGQFCSRFIPLDVAESAVHSADSKHNMV